MITEQAANAASEGMPGEGSNEGVSICQACAAAEHAVRALVAQATDPSTADTEFNWLGLCNTHAWQLAGQIEPVRAVVVARLQAALRRLSEGDSAGSGRFGQRKAPAVPTGQGECPFCAAMTTAVETLLESASASESALCLPHLCAAFGSTRRRERVQALANRALDRFNALEEELSELIRKSDYRFRDEPRGQEATSWTRTAHLLAGAPAVRWSLRRAPDIEG
jgi:hypothetical protein